MSAGIAHVCCPRHHARSSSMLQPVTAQGTAAHDVFDGVAHQPEAQCSVSVRSKICCAFTIRDLPLGQKEKPSLCGRRIARHHTRNEQERALLHAIHRGSREEEWVRGAARRFLHYELRPPARAREIRYPAVFCRRRRAATLVRACVRPYAAKELICRAWEGRLTTARHRSAARRVVQR